jgi:hypothetical protein
MQNVVVAQGNHDIPITHGVCRWPNIIFERMYSPRQVTAFRLGRQRRGDPSRFAGLVGYRPTSLSEQACRHGGGHADWLGH